MAISSTADYQRFLYHVLHSVENYAGLDIEQLVRHEGETQADVNTVLANYLTWKHTQTNRIDGTHTAPTH